jgi:hypothetical protein
MAKHLLTWMYPWSLVTAMLGVMVPALPADMAAAIQADLAGINDA